MNKPDDVDRFGSSDCYPPLTVEEARELRVCRICRGKDSPRQVTPVMIDSFVLRYGEEYAHASCIGEPLTQVWAGFPSLVVVDEVTNEGQIKLKPPLNVEDN